MYICNVFVGYSYTVSDEVCMYILYLGWHSQILMGVIERAIYKSTAEHDCCIYSCIHIYMCSRYFTSDSRCSQSVPAVTTGTGFYFSIARCLCSGQPRIFSTSPGHTKASELYHHRSVRGLLGVAHWVNWCCHWTSAHGIYICSFILTARLKGWRSCLGSEPQQCVYSLVLACSAC